MPEIVGHARALVQSEAFNRYLLPILIDMHGQSLAKLTRGALVAADGAVTAASAEVTLIYRLLDKVFTDSGQRVELKTRLMIEPASGQNAS